MGCRPVWKNVHYTPLFLRMIPLAYFYASTFRHAYLVIQVEDTRIRILRGLFQIGHFNPMSRASAVNSNGDSDTCSFNVNVNWLSFDRYRYSFFTTRHSVRGQAQTDALRPLSYNSFCCDSLCLTSGVLYYFIGSQAHWELLSNTLQ